MNQCLQQIDYYLHRIWYYDYLHNANIDVNATSNFDTIVTLNFDDLDKE